MKVNCLGFVVNCQRTSLKCSVTNHMLKYDFHIFIVCFGDVSSMLSSVFFKHCWQVHLGTKISWLSFGIIGFKVEVSSWPMMPKVPFLRLHGRLRHTELEFSVSRFMKLWAIYSLTVCVTWLGIPVYSRNFSYNMRAILVQNMWEKYAEFGEICAKICCIYVALRKYVA